MFIHFPELVTEPAAPMPIPSVSQGGAGRRRNRIEIAAGEVWSWLETTSERKNLRVVQGAIIALQVLNTRDAGKIPEVLCFLNTLVLLCFVCTLILRIFGEVDELAQEISCALRIKT